MSEGHPYADDIAAERGGWAELLGLVRSLTPEECLRPGYYSDPDWSVRDLVAHVGTWLAEAQLQFAQITAGTYQGHDVDIDALNADMLSAMEGQPWNVAYVLASAGRTVMLDEWYRLSVPNDEAAWWIRKSASEHFAEHLPRLREWVKELIEQRSE
jgi:mycothiol maleylpyruvate isomerase-like protein